MNIDKNAIVSSPQQASLNDLYFGNVNVYFTGVKGETFSFTKNTLRESNDPKDAEISRIRQFPLKHLGNLQENSNLWTALSIIK